METWQTVLLAFGGNAALLAVLGLLGKSFVEKLILRDTKQFESALKVKTDSAIENLKSQLLLQAESYKVQLKKSEFLFQREFEAASSFIALRGRIAPAYNNPDMDWSDACEQIAQNFGKAENLLNDYLAKNGPALIQAERKLLASALTIAATGNFEVVDGEVSARAISMAEEFDEVMNGLEESLLSRVRQQAAL
jgi:hypothetical protein